MNRKVTVVGGAGNVGATTARAIAQKELADVVIVDIADSKAAGVALDIYQSCPIEGSASRVVGVGTKDFAESANSDVVVITSGVPRKPGMSRDDLLSVNYKIMQDVTAEIVRHSPDCIIVPVANPLDAMCQAVYRLSKFPRERVIGMAGVLDSARMRAFIAMETGVSVENIHAFVLGGHGDTMVPLPRYSTIAGIPLPDYPGLTAEKIAAIGVRTANGGAEITKMVGTSAWYAPGSAAAEMVEIILKDKKKIVPCSVFLQGEYGIHDLFVGVPVKLGARGVEQIIQIKLTAEENAALQKSAGAVKELTDVIKV
jgi:malate dehydrogenase